MYIFLLYIYFHFMGPLNQETIAAELGKEQKEKCI